jgi:hypothetical protein
MQPEVTAHEVNLRHDSLLAWQVWEGNVCAARGTSTDLPQAARDCEQAAALALAPPTWNSVFPGGIEWSRASLCSLNLQVVPDADGFFWVVFDGTAPVAQGTAADRVLGQQAAALAAREVLAKRAGSADAPA